MSEEILGVLQTVRLKGRTTVDDIVAARLLDADTVGGALDALTSDGLVREASDRFRLTPDGKEALARWLADERATVDADGLENLYEQFSEFNGEFKELASSWQQRDGEINDHTDSAHDGAILDRLRDLHERFMPLVSELAAVAPRLAPYGPRFATAVDKVSAGDHTWFLRPIIDSYHTVWFELHEELIGLAGRSREDEALAGRAE